MMDLRQQLLNYQPYNDQEKADIEIMLQALQQKDVFKRKNLIGHFSGSAWIVNQNFTKVLMAFHHIYQEYSWLGGHADGQEDLLQLTCQEVQEESGLTKFHLLDPHIFSIEVLPVYGHIKNGQYVGCHLHYNVTYLIQADDQLPIRIKPDENSAIAWLDEQQVANEVKDQWMMEHVYQKLFEKMKTYR